MVEHNVANVRVVGSNPIFRSKAPNPECAEGWVFFRRRTQAVRERFAKPSCTSSNLVDASIGIVLVYYNKCLKAEMVELVDTRDLKSLGI